MSSQPTPSGSRSAQTFTRFGGIVDGVHNGTTSGGRVRATRSGPPTNNERIIKDYYKDLRGDRRVEKLFTTFKKHATEADVDLYLRQLLAVAKQ